ncbi:MAG: hypothetical protein H0V26_15420 [Solirubrobacterales bacterium]|nr:hypothetical protein [Solirubrobacterales bacterium]
MAFPQVLAVGVRMSVRAQATPAWTVAAKSRSGTPDRAAHVLERAHEPFGQVVGARGGGECRIEGRQADVTVAPDDLGEQPLLGREVVVQQAA